MSRDSKRYKSNQRSSFDKETRKTADLNSDLHADASKILSGNNFIALSPRLMDLQKFDQTFVSQKFSIQPELNDSWLPRFRNAFRY